MSLYSRAEGFQFICTKHLCLIWKARGHRHRLAASQPRQGSGAGLAALAALAARAALLLPFLFFSPLFWVKWSQELKEEKKKIQKNSKLLKGSVLLVNVFSSFLSVYFALIFLIPR